MLEPILQVVALCGYGNEFLADENAELPAGFGKLPVFRSCRSFAFERASVRSRAAILAVLPGVWLLRLRGEEVPKLQLTFAKFDPDRAWRAPVKGSFASIVLEGAAGVEHWTPEWRLAANRDGVPLYDVVYTSQRGHRMAAESRPDPKSAGAEWLGAVARLQDALQATGDRVWPKRLAALANLHDQGKHQVDRYPNILPATASIDRQLAVADAARTVLILNSAEFRIRQGREDFEDLEHELWGSVLRLLEMSAQPVASRAKRAA